MPHIAWPAVAEQCRVGAGCKSADRALNLCACLLHEVSGQQQNVLTALAQRWNLKIEDIKAVEQVFTEGAFADHLFQIAVGGAENAHIDPYFAIATDAPEAAIVEKTQQFGLQIG